MVPTCSNSREHESSRARLMAHRVGDLSRAGGEWGCDDFLTTAVAR